jgi:hypothetical protein
MNRTTLLRTPVLVFVLVTVVVLAIDAIFFSPVAAIDVLVALSAGALVSYLSRR